MQNQEEAISTPRRMNAGSFTSGAENKNQMKKEWEK